MRSDPAGLRCAREEGPERYVAGPGAEDAFLSSWPAELTDGGHVGIARGARGARGTGGAKPDNRGRPSGVAYGTR